MEAGVVAYRLCDRELDCQNCPFDLALRKLRVDLQGNQLPEIRPPHKTVRDAQDDVPRSASSQDEVLHAFFTTLLEGVMPEDREYSHNHLWIQSESNGESTLGVDHVLANLVSPIESLVLPPRASPVHWNEPLIWMIHIGGAVVIRSPLSGSLWELNPRIIDDPGILRHNPYGEGWFMKVRTDSSFKNTPTLLSASQRSIQNRSELSALLQCIKDQIHSSPPLNNTMQDGGTRVDNPADMMGAKEYIRLIRHVLNL